MRGAAGSRGAGESMRGTGNRDDLPTLRVTNISEETQENDLRELFGVFGRVARVYVGRDRETGAGKGFAFVSFEEKANAQKAIDKVHGRGYDNLILSVQWSRESIVISHLRYWSINDPFFRTSAGWQMNGLRGGLYFFIEYLCNATRYCASISVSKP
jgi:RNA recognition motif-containing protein